MPLLLDRLTGRVEASGLRASSQSGRVSRLDKGQAYFCSSRPVVAREPRLQDHPHGQRALFGVAVPVSPARLCADLGSRVGLRRVHCGPSYRRSRVSPPRPHRDRLQNGSVRPVPCVRSPKRRRATQSQLERSIHLRSAVPASQPIRMSHGSDPMIR